MRSLGVASAKTERSSLIWLYDLLDCHASLRSLAMTRGGLCLNYKTNLACGHPAIEGNFPHNTVIPAQAGIHCVADNYSFTPAGKPTPSLRDTPPPRGRNAPATEGNLSPVLSSPPWEEYGAAGRWVAPVPNVGRGLFHVIPAQAECTRNKT